MADTVPEPEPKLEPVDCRDIRFFWNPYGHKTRLPSYMK